MFFVSEQPDKQKSAEFDRASDDLSRGLRLCHSLVDDYRVKLAANSDPRPANDAGEQSEA